MTHRVIIILMLSRGALQRQSDDGISGCSSRHGRQTVRAAQRENQSPRLSALLLGLLLNSCFTSLCKYLGLVCSDCKLSPLSKIISPSSQLPFFFLP